MRPAGLTAGDRRSLCLSRSTARALPHAGLVRTGETLAMKNLGRAERFENLRGVLAVSPDFCVPERVLLIDDIYTTGATLDACSAVLKEAGADRVYFLTVCTGGGFMVQY